MRLGQLIRHLDIETAQAVKFLAKNGIEIEDHPNYKLDDVSVDLLNKEFIKPIFFNTEVGNKSLENIKLPSEAINSEGNSTLENTNTPNIQENLDLEPIFEETAILPSLDEEKLIIAHSEEKIILEIEEKPIAESDLEVKTRSSETTKDPTHILEEGEKVIVLPADEVQKLVESGEIISEIEAEASMLDESGILKAKFVKLEGLQVLGKIDLPEDPKRTKKEELRKVQDQEIKLKQNAGKTIDGVHPTKRAKVEGEKIKEELLKAEIATKLKLQRIQEQKEKVAAQELTKEKKKSKKKGKLKSLPQEKPISAEELKKKNNREKRQRLKEKENTPKVQKSFWQSIIDFFK